MTINTNIIKNELASSPLNEKDNTAQKIIKAATTTELRNLNSESVLRLYEALNMLHPRVYSQNDARAMEKLRTNSQYKPALNSLDEVIKLIKKTPISSSIVQSQLTPDLVNRLYAAEKKRLGWYEKIGIDGKSIGRGQTIQDAYTDVLNYTLKNKKIFRAAFESYANRILVANLLKTAPSAKHQEHFNFKTYTTVIPAKYSNVITFPALEDFIVSAYVAIRIKAATRNGRPTKDTLMFAIALYHGMYEMVDKAQTKAKDIVNWQPVEKELIKQGKTDDVNYVKEVIK
ncbi:MAG TPA: hypothetical protein ENJ08_17735 [Gammaproteobacteria bacterium]|nr:hypothetical protein [Gammaproteobacteria bacterium]